MINNKKNVRIIDGKEYKLRNLKDLDNVIDKMIDRNPDFVVKLETLIEEKLKDPNAVPRRP